MSNEIKPCTCLENGEKVRCVVDKDMDGYRRCATMYVVQCFNCGRHGPPRRKTEKAIEVWNNLMEKK
jgi:hypothetical protein